MMTVETKLMLWDVLRAPGADPYLAGRVEVALRLRNLSAVAYLVEDRISHLAEARRRLAQAEADHPAEPVHGSVFGALFGDDSPEVAAAREHLARYEADWAEIVKDCQQAADELAAEIEAEHAGAIARRDEGRML